MQVKEEFYGDGMPQIHFAGGLVRMDFATFQPDPGGGGTEAGEKFPSGDEHAVVSIHFRHDEETGGADG